MSEMSSSQHLNTFGGVGEEGFLCSALWSDLYVMKGIGYLSSFFLVFVSSFRSILGLQGYVRDESGDNTKVRSYFRFFQRQRRAPPPPSPPCVPHQVVVKLHTFTHMPPFQRRQGKIGEPRENAADLNDLGPGQPLAPLTDLVRLFQAPLHKWERGAGMLDAFSFGAPRLFGCLASSCLASFARRPALALHPPCGRSV
nr:hypothetical protein CFP56_21010 [Quercus suber]